MGILKPYIDKLVRLINLVAFDVATSEGVTVSDDASPMTKYLHIPLNGSIHKDLHVPLRAMIKKSLWSSDTAAGKIIISDRYIKITVYLKRARSPAWKPQDEHKKKET